MFPIKSLIVKCDVSYKGHLLDNDDYNKHINEAYALI